MYSLVNEYVTKQFRIKALISVEKNRMIPTNGLNSEIVYKVHFYLAILVPWVFLSGMISKMHLEIHQT